MRYAYMSHHKVTQTVIITSGIEVLTHYCAINCSAGEAAAVLAGLGWAASMASPAVPHKTLVCRHASRYSLARQLFVTDQVSVSGSQGLKHQ